MIRRCLDVVSVGLVILGATLAAGGVLLWFKLPGGSMVDLGGISNWSFRLLSGGLEVSRHDRILFVINLFPVAGCIIIPPAFYVLFANQRLRQARRAFPANKDL